SKRDWSSDVCSADLGAPRGDLRLVYRRAGAAAAGKWHVVTTRAPRGRGAAARVLVGPGVSGRRKLEAHYAHDAGAARRRCGDRSDRKSVVQGKRRAY